MNSAHSKNLLRQLMTLAWPIIIARAAQSVIGVCDAVMTAPLGEAPLTAVTVGSFNALLVFIFPMALAFIVQSFAAQHSGKGDLLAARRYAWYGLIVACIAFLVGLAMVPAVGPLLSLSPYKLEVQRHMDDYLSIRLLAIGVIVAGEVLGNWFGGLGNTRLHMIAGLVAMTVNVALNWLLIQGNMGAPALGVRGAAIASVVASTIGFAFLLLVFARGWVIKKPEGKLALRLGEFRRMLRFGVPNAFNWFLELAAFAVFLNVVVAALGTTTSAAMMVVFNINSISFMPAFGLSSAGAILAGQAIGAGDKDAVPGIAKKTMAVAAVWQGTVALVYVLFSRQLMKPFAVEGVTSDELLKVGALMLTMSAAWQLFDSVMLTLSEILRAAGDTAWTMWARLGIAWFLFTPAAYVSVVILDGGYVAAMLCVIGYLAVLAGVLLLRFFGGAWRTIDLTGSESGGH